MKKMIVGRLFVWLGAGMFALGIRYGINQIVEGGKES